MPHPRRALHTLALLATALLAAGCTKLASDTFVLDHPTLARGLAVDVENPRGSVEILVQPHLDDIRVNTRIDVPLTFDKQQAERLAAAVDVSAEVVDQQGHAILRVRTQRAAVPSEQRDDVSVTLTIRTPRADGLRVINGYGLVEAVDVRGAIQISNHMGPIEVRTSHPISEPVTLTTVDASIWYQVPAGARGVFDLKTLDGAVEFRNSADAETNQVYHTQRAAWSGVLNDGTNPVIARTNKGHIHALVLEDPVALTRTIHESLPHPDSYLRSKGSRRFLRNLPEDHPEVQTGIHSDRGYWGS